MTAEHTAVNRRGWNAIAPRRPGQPAAFFAAGGLDLDDDELRLVGDLHGRRVLQLACSSGDQVLSFANLGADATGIDIADVAIDAARAKAAEAGIRARFQRADVYDLPAGLTGFDLVAISAGGLCWMPDLDGFARVVADRLAPGGAVLVAEHHPLWEVLAVAGENRLAVSTDYFGRSTPVIGDLDDAKRPVGARGRTDVPEFRSFLWPVGDVVTALLGAGLRIDALVERPDPEMWSGLGDAGARLPATYLVRAVQPLCADQPRWEHRADLPG